MVFKLREYLCDDKVSTNVSFRIFCNLLGC